MEEREILNLFLERSEQAIESLSGKYGSLCHHIAGNILPSEQDAEECISGGGSGNDLDSIVIRDALNDYLRSLSKADRHLFLRRYYYMDSCRAIAKANGMTESAVSTRLNRLKAKLKEQLEKEGIFV